MQDNRLKMAAEVGRHFGIDPVVVLDSGLKRFALRVAAYRHSAAKEAKEEQRRSEAMRKK